MLRAKRAAARGRAASEAARSAAERAAAGVWGRSPQRGGVQGQRPWWGVRGAKPPGFFLKNEGCRCQEKHIPSIKSREKSWSNYAIYRLS